jgi:N-acetylmuramoyl-L-alanine amidase
MSAPQIRNRLSPNHDSRRKPARIDMLVLHYTGMRSAEAAIERLCDPRARVSAHYLIEENGTIWRLVPENRRAFHAGVSYWAGECDLNHVSLGIEIVNPGHEWGYRPFAEAQMSAVEHLCRELVSCYSIPPHRVIGHSDIAPDRKADPGELFDWPRLARAGIGIWPVTNPSSTGREIDQVQCIADLTAIGYCTAGELGQPVVTAFQRHFRPSCCDGRLDIATASRISEVREAFDRHRAGCAAAVSEIDAQDLQQTAKVDRAVPHP